MAQSTNVITSPGNDETACVPVTAGPPLEVKSMVMLSLSGVKVTGARKVVKTWQILQTWVSLILERLKHFRSCFLICASFPKTSSRDMLSHLQYSNWIVGSYYIWHCASKCALIACIHTYTTDSRRSITVFLKSFRYSEKSPKMPWKLF